MECEKDNFQPWSFLCCFSFWQGHTDEMWGLGTHFTKSMFVSCAYDGNIYLWDAEGHDVIWSKQLNVRSVSMYSYVQPVWRLGSNDASTIFLKLQSPFDQSGADIKKYRQQIIESLCRIFQTGTVNKSLTAFAGFCRLDLSTLSMKMEIERHQMFFNR